MLDDIAEMLADGDRELLDGGVFPMLTSVRSVFYVRNGELHTWLDSPGESPF
jgi:hypothetical protein